MATKKRKAPGARAIEQEVLLACDHVSRDPNSSKATVYGIFDKFVPKELPAKVAFFVYAKVVGAGKHKIEFDFQDSRDKSLVPEPISVDIELKQKGKAQILFRIEQLLLTKTGEVRIIMRSGDKVLGNPYLVFVEKWKAADGNG